MQEIGASAVKSQQLSQEWIVATKPPLLPKIKSWSGTLIRGTLIKLAMVVTFDCIIPYAMFPRLIWV